MSRLSSLEHFINDVASWVWGPPLIVLLVGVGVYLTFRLRLIQIRKFGYALDTVRGKYDDPNAQGEINHYRALTTALSATIGTGNIAGVATAITLGGPGALFWMWVTAFFGMATKFASCMLAVRYRTVNEKGEVSGGPMYYIEKGLGVRWLAVLFAFFATVASFGIGNMVQSNSVADTLFANYAVPHFASGLGIAFFTYLVIIGGIRRIAQVTGYLVPLMCLIYVSGALVVLVVCRNQLPALFRLIFHEALNIKSAAGGLAGSGIMLSIRYGVARGIFSNEAGLGSAPMAHAAAKTDEPVREGLVAMLGPFIDTIVICTLTGLVILVSGLYGSGLDGAALTQASMAAVLPNVGGHIVSIGLVFFAFSTVIGWSYYGDRACGYLWGRGAVRYYRWLYVIMAFVGAVLKLRLVWTVADIANACMAVPNVIALVLLSGQIQEATARFFRPTAYTQRGHKV